MDKREMIKIDLIKREFPQFYDLYMRTGELPIQIDDILNNILKNFGY